MRRYPEVFLGEPGSRLVPTRGKIRVGAFIPDLMLEDAGFHPQRGNGQGEG